MIVELTIKADLATGKLQVTGPIQDKLLCYGLLEGAKDVIRDQATPRVLPVAKLTELNRGPH